MKVDSPLKEPELNRYEAADRQRILEADRFAEQAHKGQRRKSGQSYIIHPRAVAKYLIELGVDADTVIAGLLHDVVEDTDTTIDEIEQQFGKDVAKLVDGVTKLGQIDYVDSSMASVGRHAASVENIRKLLLAMSRDMRVLIIKLADRRHNLQTLKYLDPDDRQRVAMESLEVFAPLADRLGMGIIKAELEDLAFEYAYPEKFKMVKQLVAGNVAETQAYIESLKQDINQLLEDNHIDAISVHGRQKHLYSVYRKLAKADGDITKIYDLVALRIVVHDPADCYQVLGVLHQTYRPLIYRIKDYIAVPKPNGYRSLHTTVFAKHGKIIEIQIRTAQMHKEAEYGLAAHSIYELQKQSKPYRSGDTKQTGTINKNKIAWIQELADLSAQSSSSFDMMQHLKVDLFRDRIFVFSPKGDLYDLPEGATPIDFAFAIHTDVGLRVQGAKVNGRICPLDRPLENRDMVEIITRKQAMPNRQWLSYVKTAGARSKIKSWFKQASRDSNIETGRQLLEAQLPTWGYIKIEDLPEQRLKQTCDRLNVKNLEALLAGVGDGTIALSSVLRKLLPIRHQPIKAKTDSGTPRGQENAKPEVIGAPDLPCEAAACCKPAPPDIIIGYVTRGSGVTVHRSDCTNIPNETDRLLDCQWQFGAEAQTTPVILSFMANSRTGLVHDITGLILSKKMNILDIKTQNHDKREGIKHIQLTLSVPDMFELNGLIQQLKARFGATGVKTETINEPAPALE